MAHSLGIFTQAFYNAFLDWSPHLMASLLILITGSMLAFFLRNFMLRLGRNLSCEKQSLVSLLASMTKISFIVISVISALATLGVNVNALIASLGLSGFALSFALKDTLSNTMSGILIVFYQPFKVGNRIAIDGTEGKVLSIDLRYTSLLTNGSTVLIPNAIVFTKPVKLLH